MKLNNITIPSNLNLLYNIYKNNGFKFKIVGGAVRDALFSKIYNINVIQKDFDIVTDASPETQIKMLTNILEIKKIYLKGKKFAVIIVKFYDNDMYEISTFRIDIGKGRKPNSIILSSEENDSKRRDITINALLYDINTKEIIDYVGGINDMKNKLIRVIGSKERFKEDPLRILRAIRIKNYLKDFKYDKLTWDAILEFNELKDISFERIHDELCKGILYNSYNYMYDLYTSKIFLQIFSNIIIKPIECHSNNLCVQISLWTINSNLNDLKNCLINIKFRKNEINAIMFMNLFYKKIIDDDLLILKNKLKNILDSKIVNKNDLIEFSKILNCFNIMNKFINYKKKIKSNDLINEGYSGKRLSKELLIRENNLFKML